MRRKFNVTGSCNQQRHYMVDISCKYERVFRLIDEGEYFAINRPRQYGKTTMLGTVMRDLVGRREEYLLARMSFEGVGDEMFESGHTFSSRFVKLFEKSLKHFYPELVQQVDRLGVGVDSFETLSSFISKMTEGFGRKVVLLVDEVDKSSNSQTFLNFLGLLREKYLNANDGLDTTFHSVILAAVHDIKSLKLKIREGSETKLNSPWNIAADFNVDMSFSVSEIKTLLEDYRSENEVKMDMAAIAERLFYYTNGYPFLVSKLCKNIDEEAVDHHPGFNPGHWTVEDVDWAFQWLTRPMYQTTNFDDMIKNLENNPDLYALVRAIAVEGEDFSASGDNPVVNFGTTFGILREQSSHIWISNRVYEQRLSTYLQSKEEIAALSKKTPRFEVGYIDEEHMDVRLVLSKFQEFMREHYCDRDAEFIEREGRLIFMSFLKPIINGKGFMWKEPVVADERRMDLVVSYGSKQKEVIELKLWRGPQYHEKGLRQLSDYLDFQGLSQGYLLIFDFTKNKSYKQEELSIEGKSVFAVWV